MTGGGLLGEAKGYTPGIGGLEDAVDVGEVADVVGVVRAVPDVVGRVPYVIGAVPGVVDRVRVVLGAAPGVVGFVGTIPGFPGIVGRVPGVPGVVPGFIPVPGVVDDVRVLIEEVATDLGGFGGGSAEVCPAARRMMKTDGHKDSCIAGLAIGVQPGIVGERALDRVKEKGIYVACHSMA